MELKLTRRRFGQLAIAGTVVAVLGNFQRKVFSQISTPPLVVIGVRLGRIPSPDVDTGLDDPVPDTDEISIVPSATVRLILESLDIADAQPKPLPIPQILLDSDDQVTGFTSLPDGTLVAAITPLPTRRKGSGPTRLIVGPGPTTVTISGLKKNEQLGSLVGTKDGRLLGLVVKKNGRPPARLVDVDWKTGNFASKLELPRKQRFSNLAECPDGKLYITGIDKGGTTSLLFLDLQKEKLDFITELKVNDTSWDNGLESLVCSPANQLFAFGALRYQYPNALYSVDPSSGAMMKLLDFDVIMITVAPL
jgi:hypothetical protein